MSIQQVIAPPHKLQLIWHHSVRTNKQRAVFNHGPLINCHLCIHNNKLYYANLTNGTCDARVMMSGIMYPGISRSLMGI
jgi:hypothetical protein